MKRGRLLILVMSFTIMVICGAIVPLANADEGNRPEKGTEVTVLDMSPQKVEILKASLDRKIARIQDQLYRLADKYGVTGPDDIEDLSDRERDKLDELMEEYAELQIERGRLDTEAYQDPPSGTVTAMTTGSIPLVTLGGGEYIDYASWGGGYSGRSYFPTWCIGTWDYGYSLINRKAEAVCRLWSGSWGECWAVGQVGQDFYVTGPYGASDLADITIKGTIKAAHSAMGDADASISVKLHLKDLSRGTESVVNIWQYNVDGPYSAPIKYTKYFKKTIPSVMLRAGHKYRIWLEVHTDADVNNVTSSAEYDCGPQDGDTQYAQYDYIWIKF